MATDGVRELTHQGIIDQMDDPGRRIFLVASVDLRTGTFQICAPKSMSNEDVCVLLEKALGWMRSVPPRAAGERP